MDELKTAHQSKCFGGLESGPVDKPGAECMEDLLHVEKSDLRQIGAVPIQARRFLRILAPAGTHSRRLQSPGPDAHGIFPSQVAAPRKFGDYNAGEAQRGIGGGTRTPFTAAQETADLLLPDATSDDPVDSESGADASPSATADEGGALNAVHDHRGAESSDATKRRRLSRTTRGSTLQQTQSQQARVAGSGRVCPPQPHSNGTAKERRAGRKISLTVSAASNFLSTCRCAQEL